MGKRDFGKLPEDTLDRLATAWHLVDALGNLKASANDKIVLVDGSITIQ
ncbi:MAG: hypothetical protein ACKOFX_03365 [Solirubrobacterales bacterium]